LLAVDLLGGGCRSRSRIRYDHCHGENGQQAHDIINAYSLAFFDRHLAGRPAKLPDGAAKQYPEVLFESRLP